MMKALTIIGIIAAASFIGYTIGYDDGCRETKKIAIEAIREVEAAGIKALNELAAATLQTGDLTKTSQPVGRVTSVCAALHDDGRACESDGNGGYLPHTATLIGVLPEHAND